MSSNWQMDVGLWLRFSRGTISLVRTMGSTGQASLSRSVWGTFGKIEPVAFLKPGKDATYALSPTRMQVSNATNSDLQFFILFFFLPQLFVWPSSWPTDNGFTSIGWAWHTQIVQTDNDANSTALGLGPWEHLWKCYKSLWWILSDPFTERTLSSVAPKMLSSSYTAGC